MSVTAYLEQRIEGLKEKLRSGRPASFLLNKNYNLLSSLMIEPKVMKMAGLSALISRPISDANLNKAIILILSIIC